MSDATGSVQRDSLVSYLDELLEVGTVSDLAPNGLQVEGVSTIETVVTGVSACQELFAAAVERGAQALLVHHGIFWDGMPSTLTGVQRQRVGTLLEHDLNLIAYHLPLDRHREYGNNAVAARELGLDQVEPFGEYDGVAIGCRGAFTEPLAVGELTGRCAELFGQPPRRFGPEDGQVKTLGIVSGGAQKTFHQAIDAGLDAFITGEVSEWVQNLARESGVIYLACGHYATETLGVRVLGEHLSGRFGLDVEFVDVPNPV